MSEFDIAVFHYIHTLIATDVNGCEANAGPPSYAGDILDNPDIVWSEDKWDEERLADAQERLKAQEGHHMPAYWKDRYENRADIYWHEFYKRNTDNFYKDRHYLHIVFPELQPVSDDSAPNPLHLLEVGSGVGNAVLPLLEINSRLHVHAIDVARSAIDILKSHPLVVSSGRLNASVCDVVRDPLPLPTEGFHLALCMFVLSAVPPQSQQAVVRKLSSSLKPGGKLLLRDYGRYDEAQLRFAGNSKIADNFYVRQDGTCAYFFTVEELQTLARGAGMEVEECYYLQRQYANRKQHKARYRVWIHAKFVKLRNV